MVDAKGDGGMRAARHRPRILIPSKLPHKGLVEDRTAKILHDTKHRTSHIAERTISHSIRSLQRAAWGVHAADQQSLVHELKKNQKKNRPIQVHVPGLGPFPTGFGSTSYRLCSPLIRSAAITPGRGSGGSCNGCCARSQRSGGWASALAPHCRRWRSD